MTMMEEGHVLEAQSTLINMNINISADVQMTQQINSDYASIFNCIVKIPQVHIQIFGS